MNLELSIHCISINYKTADATLRGKLAFTKDTISHILHSFDTRVPQCVLLCTCSRTEAYFCGDASTVLFALCMYSGLSEDELAPHINNYYGENALRHLFRVAGGLSSMTLGEDEILGQTKQAYLLARECMNLGYELNRTFQSALACGKRIRTDTAISTTPVSTATLAANAAANFAEQVQVLIIGASGKIGSSVLKNLLAHKNTTVTATIRQHGNHIFLPKGTNIVDFADRYDAITKADCIISATSSPHYTVTQTELKRYHIHGKKLFIDLAVPADIEERITETSGFTRIGIDSFQELSRENNLAKQNCAEAAARIIDQACDTLKKDLLYHNFRTEEAQVQQRMQHRPDAILYQLKSRLNAQQFAAVLNALTETPEITAITETAGE